ncbi:MAG TPA: hypothetical protein VMZ91_05260 [Candidatus Paceibacterota bacterium]|nr:hypothetical protein [Candidatus Paceibacterota bacterium]
MQEKVKEKPIDDMCRYEKEKGMPHKEIEKLSASQIVWYIDYISKDNKDHFLWEDSARWLDYKMREIKKLVSYLEKKNPKK